MASILPKLIGVVGAGQMGSGIAQLMAMNKIHVVLCDINLQALNKGQTAILSSLQRFARKGTITSEAVDSTMSFVTMSENFKSLDRADFVVEAVVESEDVKRSIFQQLDEITPPSTILASNTSSLSITRIANTTKRPDKVVGMHFMNPPAIMQLVEIIKGMQTSKETFASTLSLAHQLGKQTCVSEDRPGFIVNRILMPMINEAFYALMEGVSSAEDIDCGMKLGTNQPMGPLTLADFIGLDTCLSIMRVLHRGLGEDKYRPCPLLVQYVDAGWYGKKSGRGVYVYGNK